MTPANDTASRLRRLLAILTWLAQEGEAPIDDVAARFDLTPAALVTELEMAACYGVPPYSPDQLLEIIVTDETVSTHVGTALARPRRLSPGEGLALAAAARALLAVPGSDEDGALSRALAKLERALGDPSVVVELDSPQYLDAVRTALSSGERLVITYYSASTDQTGERTIVPHHLFASEGHWYVDAWCEVAEGVRRFRVDRISSARPAGPAGTDVLAEGPPPGRAGSASARTGAAGVAPDGPVPRGAFVPGPDSRRVRVAVDPSTAWLLETIPSAVPIGQEGDRPVWEVFVAGDAWLERLLLRLGPGSVVLEPTEDRVLAPAAARRILARYGRPPA
jgi:proteasome accessory factor C